MTLTTEQALAAIPRGDQPSRAAMILAGLTAGQTAPEIAAHLGVKQAYVHKTAKKAGVAVPTVRPGPRRLSERAAISPWHEAVGRVVWSWRALERDISEGDFGLLVGLSRYRVYDLEAGTADLTMPDLQKLAAVIGPLPAMGGGEAQSGGWVRGVFALAAHD